MAVAYELEKRRNKKRDLKKNNKGDKRWNKGE